MLELIEKLHDKGFIHRDIKPANFMMSGDGGKGSGKLCLIDFGLSESTSSSSSIRGKKFFGTILYASVNAHNGDAQSYRDDLEALIYVLANFMNGGLPWYEGRELDADITARTKKTVVDNIVAGESSEGLASLVRSDSGTVITELLTHCRALSFDERPDYAWCQAELVKAYTAATGREEIIEDWEWNHPSGQQKTPAVEFTDGFLDFI
ncbi:kinase-like protein [Fragilariopsis cylindrus CCMP1102]|uniref:Casein kinase I n=1 Tax=Fragilariopsis cylindrus CCMP1102 TaxID=635003 RepID=A0A1E7F2V1_9STRA|nr:kinase-like protein [Fragilariopsis cylindrus CCMP1102]|eukprot:OEU12173.1 kinase-like protein [Fragilariopsis cylindrus CCMP1102]